MVSRHLVKETFYFVMTSRPMKGLKVLLTCGPTREYIDPVRYISNDSSGHMGASLAAALLKNGAQVSIVCGPVSCEMPEEAKKIDVVSAKEMFRAVKKEFKHVDILICAAAVADFAPVSPSKHKIKKDQRKKSLTIKLVKNPDILAWAGCHKKAAQLVIGFALETKNLLNSARKKLSEKHCDVIVANLSNAIGAKKTDVYFITPSSQTRISGSKEVVASKIVKQLTCLCK